MKHKLKIGVSKNSPKSNVVAYKKASPDVKVKDLFCTAYVIIILLREMILWMQKHYGKSFYKKIN